jgi:hypothetical protein
MHSRFVAKVLAAAARAEEDLGEGAPSEAIFA